MSGLVACLLVKPFMHVHADNLWLLRDGHIGFLDFGIVGRISLKIWSTMEVFLQSLATEEYESMASSLIDMGATSQNVDSKAFARDLEKIFFLNTGKQFTMLKLCFSGMKDQTQNSVI